MSQITHFCSGCGRIVPVSESFNKAANGIFQVRGVCSLCGKWLLWVPYKDSALVKKAIQFWHDNNEVIG